MILAPAYGSAEKPSDGGEAPPPAAGASSGAGHVTIDTRYPRSIEGILRIIIFVSLTCLVCVVHLFSIQPVAIIGIILDGVGGGLGGSSGFYFFVAISHLIYIFIVFAIEMFVPNIFVHRLIVSRFAIVYIIIQPGFTCIVCNLHRMALYPECTPSYGVWHRSLLPFSLA